MYGDNSVNDFLGYGNFFNKTFTNRKLANGGSPFADSLIGKVTKFRLFSLSLLAAYNNVKRKVLFPQLVIRT